MKKFIAIALTSLLCFSFAACTDSKADIQPTEKEPNATAAKAQATAEPAAAAAHADKK